MRPEWYHTWMALGLTLLIAGGLLMALRPPLTWPPLAAAWLAGVNLVAFGYYGFDKRRARQGGRRVPELVLHGLTFAGGSLGAYAGMELFRHKTVKGSFRIFFWCLVVMQVLLIGAVVYRLVKG
jgi:uncharacterized membrane protein YsdA (DUF1294 family)